MTEYMIGRSRLRIFPSVHWQPAFSEQLVATAAESAPDAIAVELEPCVAAGAMEVLTRFRSRPLPLMLGVAKVYEEKLDFIPLAPWDSIVCALQLALAYAVELQGIDIPATALDHNPKDLAWEELLPGDDAAQYDLPNIARAAGSSGTPSDLARERHMAAQLQMLSNRGMDDIIVVLGQAHWARIEKLLSLGQNLKIGPINRSSKINVNPVVLHPLLALSFFPTWPRLLHEWDPTTPRSLAADAEKLMNTALGAAREAGSTPSQCRAYKSFVPIALRNTRAGRSPSAVELVNYAQMFLEPRGCNAFVNSLMSIPWASPSEYKMPVLKRNCHKVVMESEGKIQGEYDCQRRFDQGDNVFWHWKDSLNDAEGSYLQRRSYSAIDNLHTALAFQAASPGFSPTVNRRGHPFTGGTLEDGLAMNATARAILRGQPRPFFLRIKKRDKSRKSSRSNSFCDAFPILFLFSEGLDGTTHFWGDTLSTSERKNSVMLEGVSRCTERGIGSGILRYDLSTHLLFQPAHFQGTEYNHWAEATAFRRNPFVTSLFSARQELCLSLGFDPVEGHAALMKLAIAFAAGFVTYCVPDTFQIPSEVYAFAKRRKITIRRIPWSSFSRDLRSQASSHFLVPCFGGNSYPDFVPQILGVSSEAFANLIPAYLRDFRSNSEKMARN